MNHSDDLKRIADALDRIAEAMENRPNERAKPSTPIGSLGLPNRIAESLVNHRNPVNTIEEIVGRSAMELRSGRGIGPGTIDVIRAALAVRGLALRGESLAKK